MERPQVLWLWCLAALAGLVACGPVEQPEPVWLTIPHGASLEAVAESLAAHDLVTTPGSFRWYVKFTGAGDSLKAGSYQLHSGMSPLEIVEALQQGHPFTESLHIPAGLWLREMGWYVERQLGIPADSFKAQARDSTLAAQVGARGATLEGYLSPGIHRVRAGASAREVVWVMLEAFERNWRPEWDHRLDTLGLTRDEVVTLASIIEGEGGIASDAPYIASVYHNRLARNMRLQADPTVVYGLGRRRRLYYKDYERRSPYNTYRIDGLPPTPIGNPSVASLEASLYPAQTEFLYFVASTDGKHVFSRSYREHLATITSIR
ncbi:MAG: endolytic transglycosylase MltG [Gemmatimonadales bacterium]